MTTNPPPAADHTPDDRSADRSAFLRTFMHCTAPTDRLPDDNLLPALMGLYGEVGGIMATSKKCVREGPAYTGYRDALVEEFGDTLWYFAALCRRMNVAMEELFAESTNSDRDHTLMDRDVSPRVCPSRSSAEDVNRSLDDALVALGTATAALLQLKSSHTAARPLLSSFFTCYVQALRIARLDLSVVGTVNVKKVRGRFLGSDASALPAFDVGFPDDEQLPDHFEIEVVRRHRGHSHLRWNGVFLGDPLTDNIPDPDGYRFHDIFHLAHAAILHWSPTFRSLIKHKRKSDPAFDEAQDGGRAIVVEEGLTAWVFSRAKHLDFFHGHDGVSFDLLKTVQQFVQGYEVEACPLRLWEIAILRGYDVFRSIRDNRGGVVVGDRRDRTIVYRPSRLP